jgi:hypothetical protein
LPTLLSPTMITLYRFSSLLLDKYRSSIISNYVSAGGLWGWEIWVGMGSVIWMIILRGGRGLAGGLCIIIVSDNARGRSEDSDAAYKEAV